MEQAKGPPEAKRGRGTLLWGIRDRAALLTTCFKTLISRTVREYVSAV